MGVHADTINYFVAELGKKFFKVKMNENNLPLMKNYEPTQADSIYRPDIVVYDKDRNITHILEIESDGGKAMVGAIFLAEACISKHIEEGIHNSNIKPDLIFVILGRKYNAMKRIDAVQHHLKTITNINYSICTKDEANAILNKL